MSLGAVDHQLPRKAATSADLDHLAQLRGVGGFTDHAGVELFAPGRQAFEPFHGAVHRIAFFIARDEQADGPARGPMFSNVLRRRGRERGDGAFHIRRAAAVEAALDDLGLEGLRCPTLAHGNHIGMPGEAEVRSSCAEARIQVFHLRLVLIGEGHPLTGEPKPLERARQHLQRTFIVRCHARSCDQLLR